MITAVVVAVVLQGLCLLLLMGGRRPRGAREVDYVMPAPPAVAPLPVYRCPVDWLLGGEPLLAVDAVSWSFAQAIGARPCPAS